MIFLAGWHACVRWRYFQPVFIRYIYLWAHPVIATWLFLCRFQGKATDSAEYSVSSESVSSHRFKDAIFQQHLDIQVESTADLRPASIHGGLSVSPHKSHKHPGPPARLTCFISLDFAMKWTKNWRVHCSSSRLFQAAFVNEWSFFLLRQQFVPSPYSPLIRTSNQYELV